MIKSRYVIFDKTSKSYWSPMAPHQRTTRLWDRSNWVPTLADVIRYKDYYQTREEAQSIASQFSKPCRPLVVRIYIP